MPLVHVRCMGVTLTGRGITVSGEALPCAVGARAGWSPVALYRCAAGDSLPRAVPWVRQELGPALLEVAGRCLAHACCPPR